MTWTIGLVYVQNGDIDLKGMVMSCTIGLVYVENGDIDLKGVVRF